MRTCAITLGHHVIELCGEKLIWLPEHKLLCASDIHFEKGSFFQGMGTLLPPYDTEETLTRLEKAIAHYRPSVFVALGDSFHDARAVSRLSPSHHRRLSAIITDIDRWIWITGNHDPEITASIPGERMETFECEGLWFRHEISSGEAPEISGHYHPKAKVTLRKIRISSACFVHSGNKLILPAFGSFTGGLNIDSPDFLKIAPAGSRRIFLTYEDHIFEI